MGRKRRVLFLLLLSLTAAAGALFLSDLVTGYRQNRFWEEVRTLREAAPAPEREWQNILPEYQALYERNPDIAGWLTIAWARVDFPVMQSREEPERYLRRDFDGNHDSGGTPFLDARCGVFPRRSFNLILYGHYSNSDRLFRRFMDYSYEKTALQHREFRFDTLEETGTYQVEAAFYYDGTGAVLYDPWSNAGAQSYEFYNYIELDSEDGLQNFVREVERRTLYSWVPEISRDDQLLTIVCCAPKEYSGIEKEGKFVVISKRKK